MCAMQDSHDDVNTEVATKHSAKRVSALNEQEGQFLRRRLDTYKKIHDRELHDMVNHLEEIRETMKSFSRDPTYGTHALSSPAPTAKPVARQNSKGKLRRTQSFPEKKLVDEPHKSFPLISVKDPKQVRTLGHSKQLSSSSEAGKTAWLREPRSKMAGKSSGWSPPTTTESSTQLHRKVERSKTAPITMLQPLLKTTPEMMKKKIHISTSPRQGYNEFRQRPLSSSRGDESDFSRLETRSGPGIVRRRPTPSPLHHNPQVLADSYGSRGRTSSFEEPAVNEPQRNPGNRNISAHSVAGTENVHSSETRIHQSGATRIIDKHSAQETRTKTAEEMGEHASSRSIKRDLKQCRYSQFVKERPENNFI